MNAFRNTKMRNLFAVGLLLSAIVAGCTADLEDKESLQGLESGCPKAPAMLASRCGACHSGSEGEGSLDLESPHLEARVVGKPAECGGVLADPKSPKESALYRKIAGKDCGARMPKSGPPLSNSEIACVEAWIGSLEAP
jgi:hypothetical protein